MPFKANNNANPTGFNGRVSTRDEFMPINSIFVGSNGDMESMNQPNFYAAALAYSGQSSFGQDASEQEIGKDENLTLSANDDK